MPGQEGIAKEMIWTKVFSIRQKYALFIYRKYDVPLLLEVYDKNGDITYSARFTIQERWKHFHFTVPETGIYQVKLTFTGNCQYCSCAHAIFSSKKSE